MKIVYPIFIKENDKEYLVYVPDLSIYTEGDSFCDAIRMARDAIGLALLDYEDRGIQYPEPSDAGKATDIAMNDADEMFDYSDGVLTYVDVDTISYRSKVRGKSVKKNCTIPEWLNKKAENAGVNFSRVLQEALIHIVGED